jgi:hypothetical protein
VLGWISTGFYLSSRLPQIYKNYKRKSVKVRDFFDVVSLLSFCCYQVYSISHPRNPLLLVQGLTWMMFLAAILGNTSYALGVILRMTSWQQVMGTLPWMVGSVGTIACDITILVQYIYYNFFAKADPDFQAAQTPLAKRKRAIHDIYV